MPILTTQRLRLEPFNDSHLDGLFRLNSDPIVMRYIPGKPQVLEETKEGIAKIKQRWIDQGFGWWSFIELTSNEIIGAGCVQHLAHDLSKPLELGWRLRPDKWHQGYASEAARCMADFAFTQLNAPLLCAVCYAENHASAKVMQRLGMHYRGLEQCYDTEMMMYDISSEQYRSAQRI